MSFIRFRIVIRREVLWDGLLENTPCTRAVRSHAHACRVRRKPECVCVSLRERTHKSTFCRINTTYFVLNSGAIPSNFFQAAGPPVSQPRNIIFSTPPSPTVHAKLHFLSLCYIVVVSGLSGKIVKKRVRKRHSTFAGIPVTRARARTRTKLNNRRARSSRCVGRGRNGRNQPSSQPRPLTNGQDRLVRRVRFVFLSENYVKPGADFEYETINIEMPGSERIILSTMIS